MDNFLTIPGWFDRLQGKNQWQGTRPLGHAKVIQMPGDSVLDMFTDHLKVCYNFTKPFRTIFPDRQDWLSNRSPIPPVELEWFTDGSKSEVGTGA